MPRLTIFALLLAIAALPRVVSLPPSGGTAESPPQSRAAPDDSLAFVVNRSNPVDSLSFPELRKIFMGEQDHWSNGRRITVVMLEPGKVERQAVLSQIYKMDEKDFNQYFLHSMFTGEHAVQEVLIEVFLIHLVNLREHGLSFDLARLQHDYCDAAAIGPVVLFPHEDLT